jgi:hypothetical protein
MTLALGSGYYQHFPILVTTTDPLKPSGSLESLSSSNNNNNNNNNNSPKTADMSKTNQFAKHTNEPDEPPADASNPPYNAPNRPHNVSNLPYNAPSLPYSAPNPHATPFSGNSVQMQQAHYNQWAQYQQQWALYNQYMAYAGVPQAPLLGPQGFFYPNTFGMQSTFAPVQHTNSGVPGAAEYDRSNNHRKKRSTRTRVNTKARNYVPLVPNVAQQLNNEYETLHRSRSCRVNKTRRAPVLEPPFNLQKHKDAKIMLPAPQPSAQYLLQAAGRPEVIDPPNHKLVILDLNGTLLYRPNPRKQPKKMVGRPMLPQFLHYLFDNFAVMIWSSAKPENVKTLVEIGLEDRRSQLVDVWARDRFGLAPQHYSLNVQCYKDLTRVWASAEIQRHMVGHAEGKCFDQRNTILIDDSALKAAAQPHNLLEIPEFMGLTDEGNKQDILGQVAGYLELLKMQEDVSKFIHKTPFNADGTWSFDWEHLMPSEPKAETASEE